MNADEKRCHFCGEQIKLAAIICKYCKKNLVLEGDLNATVEPKIIGYKTEKNSYTRDKAANYFSQKQIFLLSIFTIIFGYFFYSNFILTYGACTDSEVINTLKRLYRDDFGHTDISLHGITTIEKTKNTRNCSVLMSTNKCNSFPTEYVVTIADSGNTFTVFSVDQCEIRLEQKKLQRDFNNLENELNILRNWR